MKSNETKRILFIGFMAYKQQIFLIEIFSIFRNKRRVSKTKIDFHQRNVHIICKISYYW